MAPTMSSWTAVRGIGFTLILLLVSSAQAVNYEVHRHDVVSTFRNASVILMSRDFLEELNIVAPKASYTLQEATEHLLQFGGLLRARILDTFGRLLYVYYDDFNTAEVKALRTIYLAILERRYNIFNLVPSVLRNSDTRPSKICAEIYEHAVESCLKSSASVCRRIRKQHDLPHPDDRGTLALNVTYRMYRLSKISKQYPRGFSLEMVLRFLQRELLTITPNLLSGLLYNVRYEEYDEDVRLAERKLVQHFREIGGISEIPLLTKELKKFHTMNSFLKYYIDVYDEKFLDDNDLKRHAFLIVKRIAVDVSTIDENILLLGNVYENQTIHLKYLFNLVLPDDLLEKDVIEAKQYLVTKLNKFNVVEKYLRVQKYQQPTPDQLVMEITEQLRDIGFAESIATSLRIHARFWHRSRMIESLDDLLELFDTYENLRQVPRYLRMMQNIDWIKKSLQNMRDIPVEILCNAPRACLRIGLHLVLHCKFISIEIKNAIKDFLELSDVCIVPMESRRSVEIPFKISKVRYSTVMQTANTFREISTQRITTDQTKTTEPPISVTSEKVTRPPETSLETTSTTTTTTTTPETTTEPTIYHEETTAAITSTTAKVTTPLVTTLLTTTTTALPTTTTALPTTTTPLPTTTTLLPTTTTPLPTTTTALPTITTPLPTTTTVLPTITTPLLTTTTPLPTTTTPLPTTTTALPTTTTPLPTTTTPLPTITTPLPTTTTALPTTTTPLSTTTTPLPTTTTPLPTTTTTLPTTITTLPTTTTPLPTTTTTLPTTTTTMPPTTIVTELSTTTTTTSPTTISTELSTTTTPMVTVTETLTPNVIMKLKHSTVKIRYPNIKYFKNLTTPTPHITTPCESDECTSTTTLLSTTQPPTTTPTMQTSTDQRTTSEPSTTPHTPPVTKGYDCAKCLEKCRSEERLEVLRKTCETSCEDCDGEDSPSSSECAIERDCECSNEDMSAECAILCNSNPPESSSCEDGDCTTLPGMPALDMKLERTRTRQTLCEIRDLHHRRQQSRLAKMRANSAVAAFAAAVETHVDVLRPATSRHRGRIETKKVHNLLAARLPYSKETKTAGHRLKGPPGGELRGNDWKRRRQRKQNHKQARMRVSKKSSGKLIQGATIHRTREITSSRHSQSKRISERGAKLIDA